MQNAWADEVDLQLLHLLQIAPRISWANAAAVLQLSASAAAARWSRLHSAGLAWMAVYPSAVGASHLTAFVDIDCKPGQCKDIVAQLCGDPRVVSIEECAGGRDLLLTVMVPDLDRLTSLVLDDLATLPGIAHTRTSLVTALHFEGSSWRLDALDPGQQRQAAAAAEVHPRRPMTASITEHWPLIQALTCDARISVAELARVTDRNAATVRRHLGQLLGSGVLSVRCDTAPQISGWPIACSWRARVLPSQQTRMITRLRSIPQLRMCASVTGEANLVFTIYSRTLDGVSRIQLELGQRLPDLQPLETMVHLRLHKRMGWLIGPDGRCTGKVVAPNLFSSA